MNSRTDYLLTRAVMDAAATSVASCWPVGEAQQPAKPRRKLLVDWGHQLAEWMEARGSQLEAVTDRPHLLISSSLRRRAEKLVRARSESEDTAIVARLEDAWGEAETIAWLWALEHDYGPTTWESIQCESAAQEMRRARARAAFSDVTDEEWAARVDGFDRPADRAAGAMPDDTGDVLIRLGYDLAFVVEVLGDAAIGRVVHEQATQLAAVVGAPEDWRELAERVYAMVEGTLYREVERL